MKVDIRQVNEWLVVGWFVIALIAVMRDDIQTGATFAMVAATWRLGNTWTDR